MSWQQVQNRAAIRWWAGGNGHRDGILQYSTYSRQAARHDNPRWSIWHDVKVYGTCCMCCPILQCRLMFPQTLFCDIVVSTIIGLWVTRGEKGKQRNNMSMHLATQRTLTPLLIDVSRLISVAVSLHETQCFRLFVTQQVHATLPASFYACLML